MKITILGAGNVGRALGARWMLLGHSVTYAVRDPQEQKYLELARHTGSPVLPIAAAVDGADAVLLATPWLATQAAIDAAGGLTGKVVIDATNPLTQDSSALVIGHTDSGGEQVQRWAPRAKVVKAFNSIGFNIMENPLLEGRPAVLYVAGDYADANQMVKALAEETGFEVVVAGKLSAARLTEPFAMLWIASAYVFGLGRDTAFSLIRRDGI